MQDIDQPEAIDSFLCDLGGTTASSTSSRSTTGWSASAWWRHEALHRRRLDRRDRAGLGAAAYELVAGRMIASAESNCRQPAALVERPDRRARRRAPPTSRWSPCSTDQPLPYTAGQYVSVEIARWPRVWRSYSMANAPREDNLLEFHVRAVGAGWVSSALVHYAQLGDVLRLGPARGIAGDRPASPTATSMLVGGGTGLAPLKAMIEDMGGWNTETPGGPVLRRPGAGGPLRPAGPR